MWYPSLCCTPSVHLNPVFLPALHIRLTLFTQSTLNPPLHCTLSHYTINDQFFPFLILHFQTFSATPFVSLPFPYFLFPFISSLSIPLLFCPFLSFPLLSFLSVWSDLQEHIACVHSVSIHLNDQVILLHACPLCV